jgi:hypothetical protein
LVELAIDAGLAETVGEFEDAVHVRRGVVAVAEEDAGGRRRH